MKRKTLLCTFLAGIAAVWSLGTVAYFTTDSTAVNVITAGNIGLELLESSQMGGESEKAPPESELSAVPDTTVSKIVTVKNTGESPEYVRISVKKELILSDGTRTEDGSSLIGLDFNTGYWHERDGFWYYHKALEGGRETEPLFTSVSFSKEMTNSYQDSTALLDIRAFGVQSEHNGGSPAEAAGWQGGR